MRKLWLIALWPIFGLTISGCKSAGPVVQQCPQLPPPPASLMVLPTTEAKVRAELFEPPPSAMLKSEDFKPS